MPKITNVTLTLKQTKDQKRLHLVEVEYSYTLQCDEEECLGETGFDVTVDLIADDMFDNALEDGLDDHDVACRPKGEECPPQTYTRSFIVGRSLLNEDWFGDEIYLELNARSGAGGLTEASSNSVTVP